MYPVFHISCSKEKILKNVNMIYISSANHITTGNNVLTFTDSEYNLLLLEF